MQFLVKINKLKDGTKNPVEAAVEPKKKKILCDYRHMIGELVFCFYTTQPSDIKQYILHAFHVRDCNS